MTAFDLAALLIFAVSALVGFSRGAVRELVTVLAFTVAAVIALYLLPVTAPLMRHVMHPAWAGAAAAVILVFVVAYVALRVLGGAITTRLHASRLGGIDRLVGGLFGAVRAMVVLGAFALVFNAVTPRAMQPAWITGGLTWPAARAAGRMLAAFAPRGLHMAGGLGRAMGEGVRQGFSADDDGAGPVGSSVDGPVPASPSTAAPKEAKSRSPDYDAQDRRRLNVLVERAR